MSMFCYQCQETARGTGCTMVGVCGKTPTQSGLQDLIIHMAKEVANYSHPLREKGIESKEVDYYILNSLFMTITNANFDDKALVAQVDKGVSLRNSLKDKCEENGISPKEMCLLTGKESLEELVEVCDKVGILQRNPNEDIRSLKEMITYGLKGMAAYTEHAFHLDHMDKEIIPFIEKALIEIEREDITVEELVALTLETGKFGVSAMALLDGANTSTFGHPEISSVKIGVGSRPGILVSGHDLKDMKALLEQSKDSGVDIYTHSEMLPTHYYPELKKYDHLYGNYGNAWWLQTKEFATFNGPILFTTNCIVPPRGANLEYKNKIFTTNAAGLDGCIHIPTKEDGTKDFSAIIEMAKKCEAPKEIESGEIVGGFAHNQVFALADKVVEAVKSGAIKKFVVMAGCDARMQDRKYYEDFAKALPKDTVILTAGCAKYRYNKLDLGDIGGIPRVLDAGQCNDSYSLAVIALKLKEVFGLEDINELPIAYNIAWYEQKAVIVLLALLHLGVKNIHLGPTLPGFLSPNVANVLVENFGIAGISSVDEDMKIFGVE